MQIGLLATRRVSGLVGLVALVTVLVTGCGPSAESNRLKTELAESKRELVEIQKGQEDLQQQIAVSASEVNRLKAELTAVKQEREILQKKLMLAGSAEQSASPQLTRPIVFSDREGAIQVTILSMLNGEEGIRAERLWEMKVESEAKRGKKVVYYEVMVKNVRYPEEFNVSHSDFKLEDDKGNTYQCEQTQDYITGRIHIGKTTRGGISYAIYRDSKPKRLIYRTGLERGGVPLEAAVLLP